MQTSRPQESVAEPRQAADAGAWNERGNALADLRQFEEAIASYQRALVLQPGFSDARLNLGVALQSLDRHVEALACYDQLLSIQPDHPKGLANRGAALLSLNRNEEALASYARAAAIDPTSPEMHFNLGFAFDELRRHAEALACYDRALALRPDYPAALSNRGISLQYLRRYSEALASYDKALALAPDSIEALANRGSVLQDLGRYEEALVAFERAQEIRPDDAEAHWNESLCRLVMGDFERGWKKYEWGWKNGQRGTPRAFHQPLWLGQESLAGKTILLHAEQGLGDTLQFCRFVDGVAALGAQVVLEVQRPLKTLLGCLQGASLLLARGEPLPPFDFHCPLLSLPLALGTTLGSIPVQRAYLRSDPARVLDWKRKLGERNLPLVALVWSGRAELLNDHNRSIPLAQLVDLMPAGVQYASLQKDIRPADVEVLARRKDFHCFAEDFADTAALIELMDVVISVDTSIAHLAGALGKPVWLLLARNPEPRWLLDRSDSPWYPSARLFRQKAAGDWAGPIKAIAAELQSVYAKGRRISLEKIPRG